MKAHSRFLISVLLILIFGCLTIWVYKPATLNSLLGANTSSKTLDNSLKLYWFIPDGLRAEPDIFTIYEWARQGKLPNVHKMMQGGSYGFSQPVFPGHTPTNFATLLTGSSPRVHGVADGPMRLQRYPLAVVSKSGFSSHAKNVPPIWYTLEQQGLKVGLLSVPGSTPPELSDGITVKGRWGGWGIEFPATMFHSETDQRLRHQQGFENRLFEQGQELTKYIGANEPSGWLALPVSFSLPREIALESFGNTLYALLYDSIDDDVENYDSARFSFNKEDTVADLKQGQWSGWLPIDLIWQTSNDYNLFTPKKSKWEMQLSNVKVATQFRIKLVRLGERDFFRIRLHYNSLNKFVSKPPEVAEQLIEFAGPMVDYVDNFPPQLIYYPEDKDTFMEEARMSLDWHKRAARFFVERSPAQVVIHDIYTPNQFLTSRWWMRYLDPDSDRFDDIDDIQRQDLWNEALEIYQGIDSILGEVLESADENTYIVLSSDHGAVPLNTRVRLNNLFASRGWLHFTSDSKTGYSTINWDKTTVAFLKMDNVYINPDGLGGNYTRASGRAYTALREQVIQLLQALEGPNGQLPVQHIVPWEEAKMIDLPEQRVGDLVIANTPGFGWSEEITKDKAVFADSITSGYKQAIMPDNVKGMWTPFIAYGPNIRKNYQISSLIQHVDQYPTVMQMLGHPVPDFVEGKVIEEVFSH